MEFDEPYEPQEDSFLLQKHVKQLAKSVVLDMGTGSGIQAVAAASRESVRKVLAVDISKDAVEQCRRNIKNKKVQFKQSDLFDHVPEQAFDTIIFNPPYLPQDAKLKDLTIYGGKQGYETVKRFIEQAGDYLKTDGMILLLFSSLTKQEAVNDILEDNLFTYALLETQHIFFEDLFVYKIQKSELLKELNRRGLHAITLLKKGNRGIVYTALYKKKKVAIKVENKESRAIDRLTNEAKWLKLLNKHGIGPKLSFAARKYLIEEFVEGRFIMDFLQGAGRDDSRKLLSTLLNQCYVLDRLKVTKEEMQRPYRHVIVTKRKPVMLDFERCRSAEHPKNVSQFVQFITNAKVHALLKRKGIMIEIHKLRSLTKGYKEQPNKENFKKICKALD
ncbi:methyltransferase [Candidatus Woesearchaeota archaeon]|nr:methyltransferase [Candidatus Woesearchaeota archaeon]